LCWRRSWKSSKSFAGPTQKAREKANTRRAARRERRQPDFRFNSSPKKVWWGRQRGWGSISKKTCFIGIP